MITQYGIKWSHRRETTFIKELLTSPSVPAGIITTPVDRRFSLRCLFACRLWALFSLFLSFLRVFFGDDSSGAAVAPSTEASSLAFVSPSSLIFRLSLRSRLPDSLSTLLALWSLATPLSSRPGLLRSFAGDGVPSNPSPYRFTPLCLLSDLSPRLCLDLWVSTGWLSSEASAITMTREALLRDSLTSCDGYWTKKRVLCIRYVIRQRTNTSTFGCKCQNPSLCGSCRGVWITIWCWNSWIQPNQTDSQRAPRIQRNNFVICDKAHAQGHAGPIPPASCDWLAENTIQKKLTHQASLKPAIGHQPQIKFHW